MFKLESRVEILVLHRRGMSIRAISRELNCSRRTVRKYIRLGDKAPSASYSRPCRSSKLDLFKPYLTERIEAARPKWIPATVLLSEIRERGYTGGYSILKEFLAPFKIRPPEAVVRFETEPGEQMQVDFTYIRKGRFPLLAFVATLGWSRASFVRFYSRQDTISWCDGIGQALIYFGGTPRELLFDNAKSIILERDFYGKGLHRWNPTLLSIAEQYGFVPRVCQPYRAKTKGKVERFNRYLKESFILPLATTFKQAGLLLCVDSANANIGPWLLETANARVHASTGEIPAHRLQLEQGALLPLPQPKIKAPCVIPSGRVIPRESIQHPLAVYQSLLLEQLV